MRLRVTAYALAACLMLGNAPAPGEARFEDYKVPIYHGPRHAPNFTGAGRKFWPFRTSIRSGFSEGRQFAGHYVLFATGCGAGCRGVTLGDLTSGRIYDFPLGGEENYMLQFKVVPFSRLAKVSWEILGDTGTKCVFEDVILTANTFTHRRTAVKVGNCPEWY